MKKVIFFLCVFSFVSVSAQKVMKTPKKAIKKLERFKELFKFDEDILTEYPGISDEIYRPELTKLINLSADEFIEIAQKEAPTDKDYQDKIRQGLLRFIDVYPYINKKDIGQICNYYEELMFIVNLRNSDGLLSKFRHGIETLRN